MITPYSNALYCSRTKRGAHSRRGGGVKHSGTLLFSLFSLHLGAILGRAAELGGDDGD